MSISFFRRSILYVSDVPHFGQNVLSTLGEEANRVGSPWVKEKCRSGTVIHATAGAPHERRQSEQWHIVA